MNTSSWCNIAASVCLCAMLGACATPNYPTGQIEKKYYADGPWAVTVDETGAACCDSKGNHYDLYYPTDLGANGFMHPIITWGNGTFGTSSGAAYFLKHMASWGFVIIADAGPLYRPRRHNIGGRELSRQSQWRCHDLEWQVLE
jgi:hypothetical protein